MQCWKKAGFSDRDLYNMLLKRQLNCQFCFGLIALFIVGKRPYTICLYRGRVGRWKRTVLPLVASRRDCLQPDFHNHVSLTRISEFSCLQIMGAELTLTFPCQTEVECLENEIPLAALADILPFQPKSCPCRRQQAQLANATTHSWKNTSLSPGLSSSLSCSSTRVLISLKYD